MVTVEGGGEREGERKREREEEREGERVFFVFVCREQSTILSFVFSFFSFFPLSFLFLSLYLSRSLVFFLPAMRATGGPVLRQGTLVSVPSRPMRAGKGARSRASSLTFLPPTTASIAAASAAVALRRLHGRSSAASSRPVTAAASKEAVRLFSSSNKSVCGRA